MDDQSRDQKESGLSAIDFRLLEETAEGMLLIDQEGVIQYANPAAEVLFPGKLEGLSGYRFGIPAVKENVKIQITREEELRTVELRAGEVQVQGQVAYLVTLRDITERVMLMEELERREELLQETGRMARVGGWEIDLDTEQVWWSEVTREIHEVSPDYQPSLDEALAFFPGESGELLADAVRQAREEGTSYDLRLSFVTARGNERWVHTIGRTEVWDGEIKRLHGTFQDITDRVQAAQEFQKSEERYRSLFESVPIGLYRTTPEGRVTHANSSLVDMLGYPDLESLLAVPAEEFYVDQDQKELWNQMMAEQGTVRGFEIQNYRSDGSIIWVEENARAIYDQQGQIKAYQGSLEDITDRVQAEQTRRQMQDRLQALHEVGVAVGSTLDLNEVLDTITSQLSRLIRFDSMTVQLLEGDRLDIIASRGFDNPAQIESLSFDLEEELPNAGVINSQQPVHYRDILQEYPHFYKDSFAASKGKISSWLGAPLISEKQVIGMFTLDRAEVDPFSPEDIQIVMEFAYPAAVAIRNARLHERSLRQVQRLESLRRIDQVITSSLDLKLSLKVFLNQVVDRLDVDAAAVLLFEKELQELSYAYGTGFRTDLLQHTALSLGEGYAGRAALRGDNVFISNLEQDQSDLPSSRLRKEGFVSYFGIPLKAKGDLVGVLEMFHRSPLNPDGDWIKFAEMLAQQAAIAVESVSTLNLLQETNLDLTMAYDSTIESWSRSLDMRDVQPGTHSREEIALTLQAARQLGIEKEQEIDIRRGVLLHDLGMIAVPEKILNKPGPLSEEEWETVRQHPEKAVEILKPINYLKGALQIPAHHQERWDGSGYPQGLEGEDIPLPARIFAVVDVWDALRSVRPHRKAWEEDKVLNYLREEKGKAFDPLVVDTVLDLLA